MSQNNTKKPDIRRLSPIRSNRWRNYLFVLMIAALFVSGGVFQFNNKENEKDVSISSVYQDAKDGKVEKFDVCENIITVKKKNDSTKYVAQRDTSSDFSEFLFSNNGLGLAQGSVEVTYCKEKINASEIFSVIINILILAGIAFAVIFLFRGVQNSGNKIFEFGQSKAKIFFGRKTDTSFKDVAGIDEAKEELQEVVMFLREPQKFIKLGARIPKGLLLVGAPGTGKTLLARAIAGEAGVPFFHTSGAEFEEMLVGAGASRVRDLFSKAKKAAPALVFIDEIDAVARKRGTTFQTSSTEQTLNQILVEMDGFEKNDNVIVIAATNRPDVLDPAILRPGRFDRRIVIDLPDIEGRIQILKIHSKNKPLADNVNLEEVAKRTVGYSGADLENMLNEAAIIVAKRNGKEITANDIEEAATKVDAGAIKKRKRTKDELKMTAYHEGGHAIVSKFVPESDPVHRITIVSRGNALGYVMRLPQRDELQKTKTKLLSEIKVAVAGHAAEQIIFGDVTTGAANDIEKATQIARKMVKRFGMSDKLGLVQYGQSDDLQYLGYSYGPDQRDYSESTAKIIDDEVLNIINESYEEAKKIIKEHRKELDVLVDLLLEKEVLEGPEFDEVFKNSKF